VNASPPAALFVADIELVARKGATYTMLGLKMLTNEIYHDVEE
jgi:hypothetical protein